MKNCYKCKNNKALQEFRQVPRRVSEDLHSDVCKSCEKEAQRTRPFKERYPTESKKLYTKLDSEARFEIYKRDGYLCFYCGDYLIGHSVAQASLDHIYPVSLGGLNTASNLITCCLSCNSRKNSTVDIDTILNTLKVVETRNQAFNLNPNRKVKIGDRG
jgi:5-methylcytosine-specific restriction endonuclease McrA